MEKRFMQQFGRTFSTCWRVALAVLVGIAGSALDTHGQTSYEVVAAFDRPFANGANPSGPLIRASDGGLYGTTINGGAAWRGTIFKIDVAGTLTTVHSFNGGDGAGPRGGLIQATDGSFFGTTS